MDQPANTEREEMYEMPWHFKAEDAELGRDCILVATMRGEEMMAVSLHVAHLPQA